MAQSFADIHLHIVFSTLDRRNFLVEEGLRNGIHAYIAGTLNGQQCPPILVGGVSDHVHILCRLAREMTVANLVKETKRSATIWAKQQGRTDFAWQKGYGAFAVGRPQIDVTKLYIANQEEHHRKKSFQDELRELLAEHDQAWDERYIWE